MHSSLLSVLVDPAALGPLELDAHRVDGAGEILEGTLRSGSHRYAITGGIPRFVATEQADQAQTARSFGYKWRQRHTYESEAMRSHVTPWLAERYGFATIGDMSAYFSERRRILDAGCGGGFSTSLWLDERWRDSNAEWVGADISDAIDVLRERLGAWPRTHFAQADVLALPFRQGTFDTIFAEGVLHHTPSTERALKSVASVLSDGGEILFYVYRKKAPVREFSDDHIRNAIAGLDPEAAWAALRPLTSLAQTLSEASGQIDIPADVPYLGIKAGRYDLQRFIYWHFAKLFWNPALDFEENTHVNFDWYHPRYAHRQSEDEVRRWCADAGLSITHFDTANESGFTVRARRG